jgi:hypothetical protein
MCWRICWPGSLVNFRADVMCKMEGGTVTLQEAERLKTGDRVMLQVTRGAKRGQTLTGTIAATGPEFVSIKWDENERAELYSRAGVEHEFSLYDRRRQQ